MVNVDKYTSCIDPMGYGMDCLSFSDIQPKVCQVSLMSLILHPSNALNQGGQKNILPQQKGRPPKKLLPFQMEKWWLATDTPFFCDV